MAGYLNRDCDLAHIDRKARLSHEHKASLPEWSKGVVLRTTMRKRAWVRTPQLALLFALLEKIIAESASARHLVTNCT